MRVAVVHSLPGRVRFRANPDALRSIRGSGLAEAGRIIADIPGARSAALNPRTGSILLCYDPALIDEQSLCVLLLPIDLAPWFPMKRRRRKAPAGPA